MSKVFTRRKSLLLVILILSLTTVVACSSSDDNKNTPADAELKVSLEDFNNDSQLDLTIKEITVTLTNQNDSSDKKEKTKNYDQGNVAFNFNKLQQDTTYKIDVVAIDDEGYEVYYGDDTAIISSSSQTKTIELTQTKAKGLVINFKNIPEEAASGELKLSPAQEELIAAIDLNDKQAQFNDIIAGNYALEVELFDAEENSIYQEQTDSDLSVLPGRVTNITINLSTGNELIVDINWGSTIAPQAPTGVAATATESGIKLNWDDNAAQYMVYRGQSNERKLPLARSKNNIYTDSTAIAGTSYYYWVRAIGDDGLNSDLSTAVTATAVPHQYEGVKVHFKDAAGTPKVYSWYHSDGEKVEPNGGWPGAEMKYEGNAWYYAEFPEVTDISLIFIPSTGESDQTPTLSRSQNEWWYQDGQWYSACPEKSQKPEVAFDLSEGTYKGEQELEISLIGSNLRDISAEFNGQSVTLHDTENKIDKTTIQLGDYLANGETAEITVTATNDAGTITTTATYTREDSYEGDFVFYLKYSGSDTPNMYAWLDSGEQPLGSWPGSAMTDEENGYYVYKFDNVDFEQLNLIFNWTGGQTDDLSVDSKGQYWYEDKDGDGSKELYKKDKPTISITPASGVYQGSKMIQINLKGNGFTISDAEYEFNGQIVDLTDKPQETITLSDYVDDGASATLTVTAENEVGTVTKEVNYTRDDNAVVEATGFTWDNANVYFVITDRFYNGDTSNDNSYGRPQVDAAGNEIGTFHGGDIPGLKEKIDSGYFDKLGVNAIWITAPYEQIHGFVGGGDDGSFAHYAYHGYYALDYTALDKNMGTVEEFRDFVNTAHEHEIRIVMDVVMNHPGYNTIKDMNQYNFGGWKNKALNDDWSPTKKENWHSYHKSIDYAGSAEQWANWWGPNWIRAGIAGYDSGGDDVLTEGLDGLPDFKTELEIAAELPAVLKTKWSQEDSSYEDWVVPTAQNLRRDLGIAPADYITKWLAAWVEEFGIDGFRVDTVKHVDEEQWGQLKEAAQKALESWRDDNSTAPGADWDEDFWMVGEVNPHGVDKSDYFYDNNGDGITDFDAVINFNFPKDGDLSEIGALWQDYADEINSDQQFNVMSYISSHDTQLGALGNKIDAGTALLLAPGVVQTFYGDEIDRQPSTGDFDEVQQTRSDYPWYEQEEDVLTHWQKLGQFRANHPAVGAGSQIDLGDDTYLRTFGSDKVVIKINASGATKIDVSKVFADGVTLRNAYTASQDEVSDGSIEFEAQNGVILLEKIN
ncbi:alpha-amylase family glycosyl hydrolase [Halanaerobacter jeridensis]|uniref:Alpha-amylase n=1 Tax=Halanaerobacter jeridensis TaxID=706427 RepID=A0A939BMY1_9FIRM|nr:alpha-amylase family glycosyl hydrolase [Halanaerobacter jeridensis]MBM7557750.1 alpha-amylase [Halanaerobacter jeridensis]